MRIVNTVLTLAVLLAMLFIRPANAGLADPAAVQKIAEQYKNSVVMIEVSVKFSAGTREWSGSGFFIDDKGLILTNAHVVHDDEDFKDEKDPSKKPTTKKYKYWAVKNGIKYSAHFVGSSVYHDLGLLQLDEMPAGVQFTPIPLGNSSDLKIGDMVIMIGSPYGLSDSVTSGIVSNLHRTTEFEMWFIQDFIQTDAAINPGNSGGPLINIETGKVVGINDVMLRGANGLGFAIPINFATTNLERIKTEGRIKIGKFGAKTFNDEFARSGNFQDLQVWNNLLNLDKLDDLLLINEISKSRTAIVTEVSEESPAAKAEIKIGDIITEINGSDVKNTFDLRVALFNAQIDKEIWIKMIRISKGKQKPITKRLVLKSFDEKKPDNYSNHP